MSKENDEMNLELLPNEIFLDLFDYFNGIDFLRAFYGLNTRFNVLLYKLFRSYRFKFDSISKRHFDFICQQHLPLITDQVITLQLSDHRETPEQINLFFSYIPSLCQFTYLRSLTLFKFHSYDILLTLLDQCQHLSHFTRLNLYFFSFSNASVDYQLVSNKIWNLPKLTNCFLFIGFWEQPTFCIPTTISASLEYVTIYGHKFQWNQLNRLLKHTPRLKRLRTYTTHSINDHYIAHLHPTLIRLNICFLYSTDLSKMIVFFQNTPHLRHLNIRISFQLINGHHWEQTIRNHLPKLKTLRLTMKKTFDHGENIQEEADNLLDSFRSSFWIDEHQWFVRCITWNKKIHLQTLSGTYDCLEDIILNSWQSTYPHDNPQEMYKNITSIYDRFFDQPISSNIRLPNIEYLHIKLPIIEQFWSIVPSLDKLYSLTVSSHADTYQSQVQTLLDRAPRLYTFSISQEASLPLQMFLLKYSNASVRQLDLYDCHNFDEEECVALARSSLGIQCEVLSIQVTNRQSIIHLDKTMLHLRSLTVKCADDKYPKRARSTDHNDELVQWLKKHLSSLYVIVRDAKTDSNVLIWI